MLRHTIAFAHPVPGRTETCDHAPVEAQPAAHHGKILCQQGKPDDALRRKMLPRQTIPQARSRRAKGTFQVSIPHPKAQACRNRISMSRKHHCRRFRSKNCKIKSFSSPKPAISFRLPGKKFSSTAALTPLIFPFGGNYGENLLQIPN